MKHDDRHIERNDIGAGCAVDPTIANPLTFTHDDDRTPRQRKRDGMKIEQTILDATRDAEPPKPLSRQDWMREPRPSHLTDIDETKAGRGPRCEQ